MADPIPLLVAATDTDDWDDDYDFDTGIVAGEIVEPDVLCDRDRYHSWPGICGCGRSFVGMSSGNRTTTAVITDTPITVDQLRVLVAEKHPDADDDDAAGMADDLIAYGQELPVGTVVRIWRYQIEVRP